MVSSVISWVIITRKGGDSVFVIARRMKSDEMVPFMENKHIGAFFVRLLRPLGARNDGRRGRLRLRKFGGSLPLLYALIRKTSPREMNATLRKHIH
jgi:hypothetical protein